MDYQSLNNLLKEFIARECTDYPSELDDLIHDIARTGIVRLPWELLRPLLHYRLDKVLCCVFPGHDSETAQQLLTLLDKFQNPPFTVQRICELLVEPNKHYRRIDSYTRAMEKNLLVVTTQEPDFTWMKSPRLTQLLEERPRDCSAQVCSKNLLHSLSEKEPAIHKQQNSDSTTTTIISSSNSNSHTSSSSSSSPWEESVPEQPSSQTESMDDDDDDDDVAIKPPNLAEGDIIISDSNGSLNDRGSLSSSSSSAAEGSARKSLVGHKRSRDSLSRDCQDAVEDMGGTVLQEADSTVNIDHPTPSEDSLLENDETLPKKFKPLFSPPSPPPPPTIIQQESIFSPTSGRVSSLGLKSLLSDRSPVASNPLLPFAERVSHTGLSPNSPPPLPLPLPLSPASRGEDVVNSSPKSFSSESTVEHVSGAGSDGGGTGGSDGGGREEVVMVGGGGAVTEDGREEGAASTLPSSECVQPMETN